MERKETCFRCGGSGKMECYICRGRGGERNFEGKWRECDKCWGSGKVTCDSCYGKGYIETE